jgi:ATP-dependent DNA ligase
MTPRRQVPPPARPISEDARPDLFLVVADDHAAHALSAYDDRLIRTPHLDWLAAEGMRFDNCFCTNSLCAPSRAAILTGTYNPAYAQVCQAMTQRPATVQRELCDEPPPRGYPSRSPTRRTMGRVRLPLMPPIAPMLAKPVAEIPAGQLYEPKWDGFRSIIFRDGDEVEIGSRNERPMTRYFPEVVVAVLANFPPRAVIDGEIIVADTSRNTLDFEALQQRIHPAASRVKLLAEQTPASFVAFDLLAVDDVDLTQEPLIKRREELERVLADAAPPVHITPATVDMATARRWFEQFEGAGLDGLIAKGLDLTYQPDKRVMSKVKHIRTADCVVAGYRVHKSGPDAIGSLLLGLHDARGVLASVGVVGAFPLATRKALFAELQPLVTTFDGHPWDWAAHLEGERTPRKNEGSRWNAKKDLSFVPLRPERVVEVRYDYMEGDRFRHTAQFVRWRPDRDPGSCTYDQLERPVRFDLADVLTGT